MHYPNLSNMVSYKTKDYEVIAIEYDRITKECKYHLKKEDNKIIVDVQDLDLNNRFRKIENNKK